MAESRAFIKAKNLSSQQLELSPFKNRAAHSVDMIC